MIENLNLFEGVFFFLESELFRLEKTFMITKSDY